MKKLRTIMAVFLMTVIFSLSGAEAAKGATLAGDSYLIAPVRNIFSSLFSNTDKESNKNSKKSELVVVLDAGHGGFDVGAVGNDLSEKKLTLKIAEYCKSELEKYEGVKVYMTRSKDTYVGINQRIDYATEVEADVFVSIHINSSENSGAKGAEVYYPNANYRPSCNKEGKMLAMAIQGNLVDLGLKSRGIKTVNSKSKITYKDGSAADYYAVIRGAKKAGYPGIIVEHGFISNESDVKNFLESGMMLKQLGVADANGIATCYGLKKSKDDSEALQRTEISKLTGESSASAFLKWKEVGGAGGYEIYRSTSQEGSYQKVGTVEKGSTISYKDKTVKAGGVYYYKVRPYRQAGDRKEMAGFCKTQMVRILEQPLISVNDQYASQVKISWKEVTGALRYEIYRSTLKDSNYEKIATVKDITTYKDITGKAKTTYYYKVRAVSNGIKGNTYSSYSTVKRKDGV